jgi:hypothetical protein
MTQNNPQIKIKIQWYCDQLNIPEPTEWDYDSVIKVSNIINSYDNRIIICKYCKKVDVSYPHTCVINN